MCMSAISSERAVQMKQTVLVYTKVQLPITDAFIARHTWCIIF